MHRPKPHANHYGYRVADHTEIDAAAAYLRERQAEYGLTLVDGPRGSHFAYSVYIEEPGGNTIEIEYYNPRAAQHGRQIAAGHWSEPLSPERFPGRGYVPQALSHGTMECLDKEASNRFYTDVLGLEIVGGGNVSTYIGIAGHALVHRRTARVAEDAPPPGEPLHAQAREPRGRHNRPQRARTPSAPP